MRDNPPTSGEALSPIETRIPVEGLAPVEVVAALDGETIVIDVRGDTDRTREGIPGAIETKAEVLTSWAAGSWAEMPFPLDKSRRIIVYSVNDSESRTAVETLRDMGFGRAAFLIGGLDGWVRRQEREAASPDVAETKTGEQDG